LKKNRGEMQKKVEKKQSERKKEIDGIVARGRDN